LKFTRRTFLKASAATGALAATSGLIDQKVWAQGQQAASVEMKPSLCNGCSSHCGMWVYLKNGRLWKVAGHTDHPRSRGKLCARAHGAATWLYDPNRITRPLKREGDKFKPVSWEQALDEIAVKLKEILAKDGPGAIFYGHNPRETGVFYGTRFMHALGAPTICTHNASCNTTLNTGWGATVGTTPGSDVGGAKYIIFIGRNFGEGIRTSQVTSLTRAMEKGTKVVCIDPRHNATANLASEWIPIRPGTDLALVLAMANVIISEELYDMAFVEQHTIGFDEFRAAVQSYTPEWAEPITDIPAATIYRLARELASHKPNCFIDPSWKGAFGTNYKNSSQTCRAVACLNALLGNMGTPGGLTFYEGPKFGKLDPAKHPEPPKPTLPRADGAGVKGEWPLATSQGLPHYLAQKAKEGKVKAGFIRHHNPVRNFPDPEHMMTGYKGLELLVVFETHLTETAMAATHILPEPSFLEREEVVEGLAGKKPAACLRPQVVAKIHPETRSFDEIIVALAHKLGIGQYFQFSLEELNRARLAPLGITLEELRQKGTFIGEEVPVPEVPEFKTPSGKVEFYVAKFAENGHSPVPVWEAPLVSPDPGNPRSFRLIHGKQGYHSHTATANIPYLLQITKDHDAERLWLNASRAAALGIKDGDLVLVKSALASGKVRVKVTERLHPDAAYLPSGYGSFSPYLPNARGFGLNQNDFTPYMMEPLNGHAMMMEVIVEVQKA